MASPAKNVPDVVSLINAIRMDGDPVVESAVDALGTASSGKIGTKPGFATFGLCKARIEVRIAFCERRHSLFIFVLSVGQIFIVPNVIVVIAFDIGRVFLTNIINLFSRRSLKPLLSLVFHILPEDFSFITF